MNPQKKPLPKLGDLLSDIPTVEPIRQATKTPAPASAPTAAGRSPATASQDIPAIPEPESNDTAKAPKARVAQPTKAPESSSTALQVDGYKPIPVPMWTELLQRLEAHRKATGRSNPTIVFDAIDATIDKLPDLLAGRVASAPTAKSLFDREDLRVHQERRNTERINIRIRDSNRTVLDELVKQVGAPDRSAMITAALDSYLPEISH
ncbi:hypothetical protein [Pseudoclavibacter sp. AY1H1]|uniref:hypothetical protein n=1 Tax=Pseudoclavibacter sp. AY1H1 TaxID=2080584 RepID=UPI000CE936BE|nr:hypothetical protein [Pseudoclavibacter sp. AY1H1]PPF32634.1 hypothetical protein C5E05_19205 [Pseudoclavibacter sp. AY1H1]